MMQDFIRTSTYRRAVLANAFSDFQGKVVLDVGAGSGILSFFAIQAGAKRVYAVEASNMAAHCNCLVQANKLAGRIVVISGKIEEIDIPEPVDVIISEPMGYMLYNERMLESYVHARKFLAPRLRQPIRSKRSKSKSYRNRDDKLSDDCDDENNQCSDSENSDDILDEDAVQDDIDVEGQTEDGQSEKLSNCSLLCPGVMFPTVANLYIVPFSDEALFAEQYAKANFWYQQSFHGMDLSALRNAAVTEYFNQPIVDTFDIGICPAFPCVHKVDFRTVTESQLASIDISLNFQINTCTTIHGLAFWFDVGFLGTERDVWLSTAPTEPLTHWYQVRCLLGTPLFVQEGQTLNGRVIMQANSRQSYDVKIELIVPGSQTKITNNLDLKNPHFRYNGYPPAPPPGSHVRPPTETYYASLCAQQQQLDLHTQAVLTGSNNANMRSNQGYTIPIGNVTNLPYSQMIQSNNNITNPVNSNVQLVTDQSMQLSPQPISAHALNLSSMELGNNLISTIPAVVMKSGSHVNNLISATPFPANDHQQQQQMYNTFNPGSTIHSFTGDPNFNFVAMVPDVVTTNGWHQGSFPVE